MSDDQARGGDKPRSVDDHELTGTGTPRSADDGLPRPGAFAGGEPDPAVTTGASSTSQPASARDVTINRSGSGGSGGPVDGDEDVEGSTGRSMPELLGAEDDTDTPAR